MRSDIPVGELFILGFRGPEIPGWLREFEARFGLGGVILFDYNCQTKTFENNIHSPEQVRGLCGEISRLPSRPLIFVDQEGGKVRRLKEKLGFAPLPSAQAFNQLSRDERLILADRSFAELRSLGFHFNLAPVIDLNLNPSNPDIGAVERSYSDQPEEIRENIEILSKAARAHGLGLALKHYPGLGGATVNSHLELTDLSDSIHAAQLQLFYELGKTIPGQAIVLSHGLVRQWDPENPVSISSTAIQVLRLQVPEALLISDDLQMQGLQKLHSTEKACLLGVRSGVDLLAIGNNLMAEDAGTIRFAEGLEGEVAADPELQARVKGALGRVRRAKDLKS